MLYNKIDRRILQKTIQSENTPKIILSFYKYTPISNLHQVRDSLYKELTEKFAILGRIYLATEGINAQISIPDHLYKEFINYLENTLHDFLKGIFLNEAIEHKTYSFYKLTIKVKKQIVADNLKPEQYDIQDTGQHIDAKQFNQLITDKNSLIIDMRNFYESEIGHFQNAILPNFETFRESLPIIKKKIDAHKNKQIALYCTGGIRCEKASAYLKKNGFKNLYQLKGGILSYIHQVQKQKLKNFFKGKIFVFDERLGEQINNHIISFCHQCKSSCDTHTNCSNKQCHTLFIQCSSCKEKYQGFCSQECIQEEKNSNIYFSLQLNINNKLSEKNIRKTNKYRIPHIKSL